MNGATYVSAGGLRMRAAHPALIAAGDDDPTVPLLYARLLAARLPDSRVHVVKGGGHLFLLDQPPGAVAAIGEFLDAVL